jgi:hypothetical protein
MVADAAAATVLVQLAYIPVEFARSDDRQCRSSLHWCIAPVLIAPPTLEDVAQGRSSHPALKRNTLSKQVQHTVVAPSVGCTIACLTLRVCRHDLMLVVGCALFILQLVLSANLPAFGGAQAQRTPIDMLSRHGCHLGIPGISLSPAVMCRHDEQALQALQSS